MPMKINKVFTGTAWQQCGILHEKNDNTFASSGDGCGNALNTFRSCTKKRNKAEPAKVNGV